MKVNTYFLHLNEVTFLAENIEQYQIDLQGRLYHLLQTIKAEKKWTNKDLAKALDVSVSLIEKWCSNSVSSFVKNYFDKIVKLADISGHTASSLVAMLDGADCKDDFYSDIVKNLASTPTSFQIMINDILKLDIQDRDNLKNAISFYLNLDKEQRKAIEITLIAILGVSNDR